MKYELNHGEVIDFVEARIRRQLSQKRLEVDLDHYQAYLADSDLSGEQKTAFVNALWTVIVSFVDLGYGVHPVQSGGAEIIRLPSTQTCCKGDVVEFGGAAHV